MSDQAAELRKLVMRATRERAASAVPPPKLIALLGGKGGVGTTTLAVNLAIEMARQALRTVLIDANLYRSDVAAVCGIRETHSIADVLTARRDIHEVLVRGPSGLQIVPGVWAPGGAPEFGAKGEKRLFQQIRALGLHADVVVVDCGDISNSLVPRFWAEATDFVLVTTGDSVAVMNAYAAIKMLHAGPPRSPVKLLINRALDETGARDAAERIERSCQRFLGAGIQWVGYVPDDVRVGTHNAQPEPYILAQPTSDLARSIHALAAKLMMPVDGAAAGPQGASVA